MNIQLETQRAVVEELQEHLVRYARFLAFANQGRMNAVGIRQICIGVNLVPISSLEKNIPSILTTEAFDRPADSRHDTSVNSVE